MRSRILIGTSAWVLGAVAATTGSLYAADQLARGLLEQNVAQVTIAKVNAELAAENKDGAAATSPSANANRSPGPRPSPGPAGSSPAKVRPPKARPSSAEPTNTSPGQLLTASDGTVMAACKPGGAYLVYWSPQPGFEAENVHRGPLKVASVEFVSSGGGGELVKVTCVGGTPTAHVSSFGWGGDE